MATRARQITTAVLLSAIFGALAGAIVTMALLHRWTAAELTSALAFFDVSASDAPAFLER
jgi:hypothetical protein